ncbi:Uncharacterised protein [Candidatus Tiddalikarchaeum anstoanum]|nr:Uncharacterised protein [Candidatus Tiddalikarchaeum anstoanum]
MGLFDKKKSAPVNTSFPEPPARKIEPAFPEPPKATTDLDSIKEQVEKPVVEPQMQMPQPPKMDDEEKEPPSIPLQEEDMQISIPKPSQNISIETIPEPVMPTTINPILYVKLAEYKDVVEATNNMRKDIEKIKSIVSELRKIEKEEHLRLEKSEELIRDINNIVNLFEKTMVAPTE